MQLRQVLINIITGIAEAIFTKNINIKIKRLKKGTKEVDFFTQCCISRPQMSPYFMEYKK